MPSAGSGSSCVAGVSRASSSVASNRPYIVDFVSLEHRLAIELDGGQHAEQADADQQRDAWLRSQGFRVLRFWNSELFGEFDAVLEAIRLAVEEKGLSSPSPLPLSREWRGVG